jgi:hypothetical protein
MEKFLRKLARNMITVVVLMLTAMGTIWVYATVIEPINPPASSDQDFTQSILGANNANNDFDSSLVTGNADGSIIERLEYIIDDMGL